MDLKFRNHFLNQWAKYFGNADLPITFFYTDDPGSVTKAAVPKGWSCIIGELALVRNGKSLAWNLNSLSCGGSQRYFGYTSKMRPNFEYFLSYGIENKMEGERYIQSPEMVKEIMSNMRCIPAKGKYIVFKRFDNLTPEDEPVAAIFFATQDVLSGLFTLANFDQADGLGVIAPFGSGCSSIVYQPYFENEKENPRAVMGLFDVSARPYVPKDRLTLSIPMKKFRKMVGYMDESFLITESWEKVRERINKESSH